MSNLAKHLPPEFSGNYFDVIQINHILDTNNDILKRISKIYRQFHKNQVKSLNKIVSNDITWNYEGVKDVVPFTGTYQGKTGVKDFWKTYLTTLNFTKINLRYYVHDGNIVHLHWTEEGIVKSTNKQFVMETVQRWEFNDQGEILKFRWYNDTFAMYHAFQPDTDPKFSLASHPADYNITGDSAINGLPIIEKLYADYLNGDMQKVLGYLDDDVVYILAGPENLTPFAGTWLGSAKFIEAVTTFLSTAKYETIEFKNFTGHGSIVDAEFVDTVLVYETGKIVPCSGLHSFIINSQGKIIKFRSYNDTYNMVQGYIKE
ncbi:MAG: nuclear transport factor 2 family protein [Firmicutes bacterium]|nr:nuclear transport factor 2 family protein [Bacillota bacterium]